MMTLYTDVLVLELIQQNVTFEALQEKCSKPGDPLSQSIQSSSILAAIEEPST